MATENSQRAVQEESKVGFNPFRQNPNLFPSLSSNNQQRKRSPPNKTRPYEDFMSDADLSETVHCSTCDEVLIKAFAKDHVCDKRVLDSMTRNSRGQLAQPLN